MKRSVWFYFRLAVIAVGAVSCVDLLAPDGTSTSEVDWSRIGFISATVAPSMMVLALATAFLSKGDREPSWSSNPFRSMLDLMHFAASISLAAGLGSVVRWIFTAGRNPVAFTSIIVGAATLLGIVAGGPLGAQRSPNKPAGR